MAEIDRFVSFTLPEPERTITPANTGSIRVCVVQNPSPSRRIDAIVFAAAVALSLSCWPLTPWAAAAGASTSAVVAAETTIPHYRARFERQRPLVAVVGENSGTELTDFVIPYGVLSQSGAADVVTVATHPGDLRMRPALKIRPDYTIDQFDARFAEGADYVIVPAVGKRDDPTLLAWVAAQSDKGATLVSICDGALVLAHAGLLEGRRAVAHWATHSQRRRQFPETEWMQNTRYVADGNIVSTAGISAAIPTSIALVEAIAGRARAAALAAELGVADWSARHDSERFRPRLGVNLKPYFATVVANPTFHRMKHLGLPVSTGVDEMALALTVDAFSRTGRSHALSFADTAEPIVTRNRLLVIPDVTADQAQHVDEYLPALPEGPSMQMFDVALNAIAQRYGRSTARGVALAFEYADYEAKPASGRH